MPAAGQTIKPQVKLGKRADDAPAEKPRRFLRMTEVIQRVGMSKTAIYARIRAKNFPAPVPLGGGMVAWVESELDAWMDARVQDRDAA